MQNTGVGRSILSLAASHLPEMYVVISLLVSVALCLLTPPFFVPDEAAHSLRAIQIGHGELIGQRSAQGVGGWVDLGAAKAMDGALAIERTLDERYPIAHRRPDGRITEAQLRDLREIKWAPESIFSSFPNTAVYPPILYLPQAVGWRIGEAADFTIVHSLLLARLLAACSAIAIGWLAMRLCASGRWLLFAYLLLPTALSLNASCSQDAVLLAVAALIMALISRPLHFQRGFTVPEIVAVTGLLTVYIAARPPYLPLVLVLLLPGIAIRTVRRRQMIPGVLAILVACSMLGGWEAMIHSLGNMASPEAQPARQVRFLRAHPLRGALNVMEGTAREAPKLIVFGAEVLGENDVFPPAAVYVLLYFGIAGILVFSPMEGLNSWPARWVLVLALGATVSGISFAEYIIWTPPEAHAVLGLQSRYYLPLVPFFFFLFTWGRWRGERGRRSEMFLQTAGILFVAAVLCTPWVAAHRFYKKDLLSALSVALR
jgi:hypothetical protein